VSEGVRYKVTPEGRYERRPDEGNTEILVGYRCGTCWRVWPDQDDLKEHERQEHGR
jgi:hypothetical protein